MHVVPGSSTNSAGAATAGAPSTSANTSRRPASTTGSAPGAPAASASSVEIPASRRSSANASPRAAASPIRTPVKLPGPVPTTSRLSSRGWAPASSSNSSASARTRTAREERSPSTSPFRTSALVATPVAVSNASVSIAGDLRQQLPVVAFDLDRPVFAIHVRQTYRDAHGREDARSRLGPFDEADCILEIGLQITPLRGRDALESKEIEVGDVRVSGVAVADGEGRARHGHLDPERAAGAANERRLAGAELARDGDHVANQQPAGKPASKALRLFRRRRGQLEPGHTFRTSRSSRLGTSTPSFASTAWRASRYDHRALSSAEGRSPIPSGRSR